MWIWSVYNPWKNLEFKLLDLYIPDNFFFAHLHYPSSLTGFTLDFVISNNGVTS
jgi:hypothetical protein